MLKSHFISQSAKTNLNVEEVFFSIGRDIKQRLADSDSRAEVWFLLFEVSAFLITHMHHCDTYANPFLQHI